MNHSILKNILYIISIIIIFILIKYIYYYITIKLKHQYINIDKCVNIINTGDLVLFICNIENKGDLLVRLNSYFSHCGMIIEIDNYKYILELTTEENENYLNDNVNLVEFNKRVKNYKGEVYILKCNNINISKYKKHILNHMHIYKKYKYDNNLYFNYLKAIFNFKTNIPDMFCSEFYYHILTKLGLVHPLNNNKIITPIDIYNLKIYDKNKFYKIIV
jgi:hypothetical protein